MKPTLSGEAFGAPGIGATWTSSAKDLVTTAINGTSRVWLTLGHGIANEIYWPSTGQPQVRDLGFLVDVGDGEIVEVKRANRYHLSTPADAVLAPSVVHDGDGWSLRLDWVIDPDRDAVLIRHELSGRAVGLYVLVAPHLASGRETNSAWVDDSLFAVADSGEAALCLASQPGFIEASAGYAGASDGWQDLIANRELTWHFRSAPKGNVALVGRVEPTGTLALGLSATPEGAAVLARSALDAGFERVSEAFVAGWTAFAAGIDSSLADPKWRPLVERSAAVLACHEDRTFPGAMVASLSIPWGSDRDDLGGYHLVWSRDCVESALARLAIGDRHAALRTLHWLCATQKPDGHWTQNAFPDGRPYWTGIQLDEVALPVVLAAALDIDRDDQPVRQMVQAATRYLLANGPASQQDRWEENSGTNAFTLAAVIAALIAARRWLDRADADYACSVADYWNARIEDWLYSTTGDLAADSDVVGYYIRLGRSDQRLDACGRVDVRNQLAGAVEPDELVACDFLALTRFGLRSPRDPRIVDTVTVIDEVLAADLPTGVAYRRYNHDGYGEHDDGRPFDGTGVGRPWPLLAGERGHYAFQAGHDPAEYLASMQNMAGPGLLLPEQVWDGPPIPERFLEPGRPSGSAMPLAWAHAEFIKLATVTGRGRPIESLDDVVEHLQQQLTARVWYWRFGAPFNVVPPDTDVVVDHAEPFVLRTGSADLDSEPVGLGRHGVRLRAADLPIDASFVKGGDDVGRIELQSD